MDLSVVELQDQLCSEQEPDIIHSSQQACTKKIKELQDENCRLTVQIQRLDIALVSQNELPPEVLHRCCREFSNYAAKNQPRFQHCHAGITPEFWTNVSIGLKANNEHQLQIVEQWFSRAGNHPRSLIFMDTECDTAFHLSLPNTQIMPLKELLKGPFLDYLTVLDIHRYKQTRLEQKWPSLFASITRLTKLIDVRLAEFRWDVDVRYFMAVISCNQLQYLDLLLWIPYPDCLDILSKCASLVHCRMNVDDTDSLVATLSAHSARKPVVLPALRVLQLFFRVGKYGNDGFHVQHTIRSLSVPRLSHLTLDHGDGASFITFEADRCQVHFGSPAVCELLERSNGMPDLVSLDLGVRSWSDGPIDVRVLLMKMPRLQLLHVRNGIFDEGVRNDIATGTLGPQLRSIMTQFRHEAIDILQMVELRHQNASTTPRQITKFTSVSFSCHKLKLGSKKHFVFSERLARLKNAAPPRPSIKLSFD